MAARPSRNEAEYFGEMTGDQHACLAWGHRWPELIPGRKVPKGFRVAPSIENPGCFLVTETCSRCGTERTSLTLPKGFFDRDVVRAYKHPGNWKVRPEGAQLTRRDFTARIYEDMWGDLFGSLVPAGQEHTAGA